MLFEKGHCSLWLKYLAYASLQAWEFLLVEVVVEEVVVGGVIVEGVVSEGVVVDEAGSGGVIVEGRTVERGAAEDDCF